MTSAPSAETPPPKVIPLRKVLVVLAIQALVMVAIGLGLWRLSDRPLAAFVTLSAEEAVWGAALGFALIAVAYAVFRGLPRIGEALVRLQAATYGVLGTGLGWPAIVVISICAGVGEEALFRGGLQTLLGDMIGVPAAILVSAASFAAVHFARPVITLLVFLVGALFGLVYWQTGSLLTVMIGHALYDVWALRYLLSEFRRLGLTESAPTLAKPAAES